MSSTLVIRKTPVSKDKEFAFKYPVKAWFGKKFYDHDGSCGGEMITIGSAHLDWLNGLLTAWEPKDKDDQKDKRDLQTIADMIEEGHTVDIWFDV